MRADRVREEIVDLLDRLADRGRVGGPDLDAAREIDAARAVAQHQRHEVRLGPGAEIARVLRVEDPADVLHGRDLRERPRVADARDMRRQELVLAARMRPLALALPVAGPERIAASGPGRG